MENWKITQVIALPQPVYAVLLICGSSREETNTYYVERCDLAGIYTVENDGGCEDGEIGVSPLFLTGSGYYFPALENGFIEFQDSLEGAKAVISHEVKRALKEAVAQPA